MTTGQRMKDRRKAIGLSAERVADILGVSPATIYRYENGDIEKVPGERLEPIARALQTTPAYLMGWENDENRPPAESGERKSKEEEILFALSRGGEQEITDEMFDEVRRFAEFVAHREKDKK